MRSKVLLLLILAIPLAKAGDDAERKATAAMANQHMVINFLSGWYYCTNQRWPESAKTLRKFQASKKISLPVTAQWDLLESDKFTLDAADNLVVRSIRGAAPDARAITSTNQPPGCHGHDIELKAHLNIED